MKGRYKSKIGAVIEAIRAGAYPKEAAMMYGANRSYGCKAAKAGGLSPRYLTDEEWRAVLAARAELTGKARVTPGALHTVSNV